MNIFCRMTSDVISKSRFSMRFSKARRSLFEVVHQSIGLSG